MKQWMSNESIADVLEAVAERLTRRPWDTGIEKVLEELAEEFRGLSTDD